MAVVIPPSSLKILLNVLSRVRGSITERGQEARRQGREDQDLCASRTEVFHLDRRVNSSWIEHV